MTIRYVIFAIFLLLIGVVGFYYFRGGATVSQSDVSESDEESPELSVQKTRVASPPADGVYRTDLHPLADPEVRAAYVKRAPESWDDWAKSMTEFLVGTAAGNGYVSTPEEVEAYHQRMSDYFKDQAARYARKNHPLPEAILPMPDLSGYDGPQTAEALIAEFDIKYKNRYPNALDIEEHYLKETFLQRLLDKGALVKNIGDYKYYLNLRGDLLYKKETPKEWHAGKYGIPITTNFAEFEEGFLDRKVWENSIIQQVSEANPGRSVTVYFPANHPDKYLPVIGKMRYVRMNKNHDRMSSWGTRWTDEQSDNVLSKGIEPEDIEIVYIDKDYNILPEPPPLVGRETRIYNTLDTFDGIKITPENYVQVVGHPMPAEWLEKYEARQAHETQDTAPDTEAIRAAAREAAAAAQETAKAEFEKFQNSMRQLEEFATMSDVEIEKALERQFRRQFLPEHPGEQITPERLENALGTLFQHGFEEGFRRVRRDSPALAEQLERFFGLGQRPPPEMQKKPQRPAPPKPSEAAPSEPEAP